MTKELYISIYSLITNSIETKKNRKEDLVKVIIDLSECQRDIAFQTALNNLKKVEYELSQLEVLLENFVNEIQEP